MHRRHLLRSAASLAVLGAPRIAHSEKTRVLRFVPTSDLVVLDPVWTTARPTRNHAYLVFDTLYGIDEALTVQPQMAAGQTIGDDGKRWTITLRENLRFHDGEPVLARDVATSIQRFCARDGFGQGLLAATNELSALDDRRIEFRLKKPFPHLAQALAGSTAAVPCIMPARLAATDPFKAVTEMVGSGPYRFLPNEHNAGSRSAYERFQGYAPRDGAKASFLAGAKIAHFDRIEWHIIPDAATAAAALRAGEVDWWELPTTDLMPMLGRDPNLTLESSKLQTATGIMRFNQLHPPFDNPAIRRALLGAVDQAAAMQAVGGTDPANWSDRVGLFGPGVPLANDAGVEVVAGPRDYDRVKRDLAAAGYHGQRIVALDPADIGVLHALSLVGIDQLRKSGMDVDAQVADFGTVVRRRSSTQAPEQGGWNVFFTLIDGAYTFTPAGNPALTGNGKAGWPGWPMSPRIEELRQAWLDAPDLATEQVVCRALQMQLWQDVPYIPMGQYRQYTCYRRTITDVPRGFALFYGVRPS